jgi:hypothetical protein
VLEDVGADDHVEAAPHLRRQAVVEVRLHEPVEAVTYALELFRVDPDDGVALETEELAEAAVGAPEVNFYAYGLYRLGALDRIASALASSP